MELRIVGGNFVVRDNWVMDTVDPNLDDKPFIDDLKLSLLGTLSTNVGGLIEKYGGTYFTGYKDLDNQILGAICHLSSRSGVELVDTDRNQSDDKLKKLLYILRNIIAKKGFSLRGLPLCNGCRDSLESVLLTAVNKFSMEELEKILYFDNITFDFLENLNCADISHRFGLINNIDILRNELGVKLFPLCLAEDNINNMSGNVSYLKNTFPNMLKTVTNHYFNTCLMQNNHDSSCFLDFLLLNNSDFKLLLKQIEGLDGNFLSVSAGGYSYYKMLFDRIRECPDNEIYLGLLKNFRIRGGEWAIFRVDNGLPVEMLAGFSVCRFTYQQCCYVYENITKDSNQLKELFKKNYSFLVFFGEHFKRELISSIDSWKESKIYKLEQCNLDSIKFLFENGVCDSIDDFIEYIDIIKFFDSESLSILVDLFVKQKNDYYEWLSLFGIINTSSYDNEYKNEIIHKVGKLPLYMAKRYVQICEMFDNSDYSDISVLKDYLIMDILNAVNPEDIVNKVKIVFMQSYIPLVSKILKIFEYVYSEDNFNDRLNSHSSRYLQSLNTYGKKLNTIYQDLMHIMIDSGELSLKEFIKNIISSRNLLYEFEKGKTLSKEECNQILMLMRIIVSLNKVINNNGWNSLDIFECRENIDNETLKNYYKKLKDTLLIRDSDSLYAFFMLLCKKIGYGSLEDIISKMDEKQRKANCNGLCIANGVKNGQIFNLFDNYFLKGIDAESFGEILNRGVTSTEYLGGGEGSSHSVSSNSTPFDADGVMVKGEYVFDVAKEHGYGELALVIDINKSGIYNTDFGLQGYKPDMYELFKNHGETSDFYGIRTGIASTEFDAIIFMKREIDMGKLQKIKYLIAKNGFYLPVFDLDKNLIFTPEEYHTLRGGFSFSDRFKGYDVEKKNGKYITANQNDKIKLGDEGFRYFVWTQKNGLISDINFKSMAQFVFEKIKNILESEFGIQCNNNKNFLGAELYDSGSTGRGTQIPSNDIDLDFTLLLNSQDYEKIDLIQRVIHEKIGTVESNDHGTIDGTGLQIKSVKNGLGMDCGYINGIHFDLLVLRKTKSYLYPSNVAIQDRFQQIKKVYGRNTLDFVIENIVIMKKLLKSQGTYKNTEGGIGGIGVENWIMQHHGNFVEALEAFENVAYGGVYEEGKKSIPFEEFKNYYFIWDVGHNFKDGNNDNYILKMNEVGYNGVLNIIRKYRKDGINGIIQMIQEYNDIKAQFLKQ